VKHNINSRPMNCWKRIELPEHDEYLIQEGCSLVTIFGSKFDEKDNSTEWSFLGVLDEDDELYTPVGICPLAYGIDKHTFIFDDGHREDFLDFVDIFPKTILRGVNNITIVHSNGQKACEIKNCASLAVVPFTSKTVIVAHEATLEEYDCDSGKRIGVTNLQDGHKITSVKFLGKMFECIVLCSNGVLARYSRQIDQVELHPTPIAEGVKEIGVDVAGRLFAVIGTKLNIFV
jgi:hypothetical protein